MPIFRYRGILEYLFFWVLFPILSSVIAFGKNRDTMGWFFIGTFLGPLGLVVAFLPKIDRTAFVQKQLKNVEFYVKQDMALKQIAEKSSLRTTEVAEACSRLLMENSITEDNCIKVLGGVPPSSKSHYSPLKALRRKPSPVVIEERI